MVAECCIKGCTELVDADRFIADHGTIELGMRYAMCPEHLEGVLAPAKKLILKLRDRK